jgi:TfoX/Sxy family transcriptional regulator of competence genes
MKSWKRVPPELAAAFDAALPASPLVQRRSMFGCPCAFVNGHMFAGTHEDRIVVRVPEDAARRPFVVMGRTMKEYMLLERPLELSAAALAKWVARGFAYASALPPKQVESAPGATNAAKASAASKAVGKRSKPVGAR